MYTHTYLISPLSTTGLILMKSELLSKKCTVGKRVNQGLSFLEALCHLVLELIWSWAAQDTIGTRSFHKGYYFFVVV